ncbi:MAG: hypothetical protein RIB46_01985 [Pseudomonadales bacterium]
MRTSTIQAVLLSALLLATGHALAGDGDGALAMSVPARVQGVARAEAQPEAKPAAETESSQGFPVLSLLGALGLGVIGLLWVRRHTAEL